MQSSATLTRVQITFASLRQYPRLLLPIALGIAAATATIVGALLVGDSLRGSLRFLALDRIGRIEHVLLAPNFFQRSAIDRLQPGQVDPMLVDAQPVILFTSTSLEFRDDNRVRRTSNILTLGIEDDFWQLGDSIDAPKLELDQIMINEAVANELGVQVGDKLVLQVPAPAAVPADNPLGKRDTETVAIADLTLVAILPSRSIARLDLQSNQRSSLNAFLSAKTIQRALSRPDQFNAAMFARAQTSANDQIDMTVAKETGDSLLKAIQLSLSDLGFHVDRHVAPTSENANGVNDNLADTASATKSNDAAFDYFQLTSDRLIIQKSAEQAVMKELGTEHAMPMLAYLANGIQSLAAPDRPIIPYSTIVGVEPSAIGADVPKWQLNTGAFSLPRLQDNECFVNSWLASFGKIEVGDIIRVEYFQSENEDGKEIEKAIQLKVAGIVPITEPSQGYRRNRPAVFDQPPTAFNDPDMTPSVTGITDQESISQWETPFPLTRAVSQDDDDYWKDHRLTPKLMVTLKQSQELFGSRFGEISSIRISPQSFSSKDQLESRLTKALQEVAPELGWQVLPLRAQQLKASSGTTPFDGLFLALSFFVIMASLMLIFLLVRLYVETRANHWGILKASGWSPVQVRRLILVEAIPIIALGVGVGLPIGFLFCKVVLAMLKGQWVGAIGVPFLEFHWTYRSLLTGAIVGGLSALGTIWFSLLYLSKRSIVSLLRGNLVAEVLPNRRISWLRWSTIVVCFLAILGLPLVATQLQGPAKAGAFLGAGFCALVGLLVAFFDRFVAFNAQDSAVQRKNDLGALSFAGFTLTSVRRNRLRTTLAVSLIAVASFLLLSVSLFHVEPDEHGTGGFALMARSDLPIVRDVNDLIVRQNALGQSDAEWLSGVEFVPMRLRGGDDAGCSNLYQANQPQVLGVNAVMAKIDFEAGRESNGGSNFAWAGQASLAGGQSVWELLEVKATGDVDSPIPVVVDQNTAMWGLHLKAAVGEVFAYEYDGRPVYFQTVGLLQNTILQGYLLIGETNFKTVFPEIVGNRFFLVKTPLGKSDQVSALIERGWANEGLDALESRQVLSQLLAVQNTYLSAFQSLGTLGLILGTLGLAVIQIRSVVERRSEFGLLRALGFDSARISLLLLAEHLLLLLCGAMIGTAAALIAVAFAAMSRQAIGGIGSPLLMLLLVLLIGTLSGLFAVSRAIRVPVLSALKSS